jgi:site-specific recombinase XerD
MIEEEMPEVLQDYFIYLKSSVAIKSRQAYLGDLKFFFEYLINRGPCKHYEKINDLKIEDFQKLTAKDVNRFIGDFCMEYTVVENGITTIMTNNNRTLSRKKSSISVFFKFLYRENLIEKNITDGFNPIRMPKPQPDAIKRLDVDEMVDLLERVDLGSGLTEKERQYWLKTHYRDRAIMVLFVTYGLRLSELQQLNLSSINFSKMEFRIYRKRGKEVLMPLNNSARKVIEDYILNERFKSDEVDEIHRDALFYSLQKTRLTERAIRDIVKKYTALTLGTSKQKGYSPHKLRATAASTLIEHGFSIYDVQNLLDHDNITTTQLYSAHRKNAKKDLLQNQEVLDFVKTRT